MKEHLMEKVKGLEQELESMKNKEMERERVEKSRSIILYNVE